MFACALLLSAIAAFYSIAGLAAIFAAAATPIIVMGSVLEASKLVVASWLYRNWTAIPLLLKTYLTTALVVLMFLTSMGIFGFLSKAHLDQGVPTADIAMEVAMIDDKIQAEKDRVNAARQTLNQLDQQVNEALSRTTDARGTDRSVAIRRAQARERAALQREIELGQLAISRLSEQRAPKASELRKVEAEVGPIKYIAAVIYGNEANDPALLEKAVQWVTILIVAVFDPLAVIMLIAANWSLMHRKQNLPQQPVFEEKPDNVEEKLAQTPTAEEKPAEFNWRNFPYLTGKFAHFKNLKPMVATPQESAQPTEQPAQTEHPAFQPHDSFWKTRTKQIS